MIRDLVLPQLSMGMSEGTIVDWTYNDGDYVERDAAIGNVETEKVVHELTSPYNGYLQIVVPEGAIVPIDTVIARIADAVNEFEELTTVASAITPEQSTCDSDNSSTAELKSGSAVTSTAGSARVTVSGLARKIANDSGIDLDSIRGTGPGGRIERKDVLAAIASRTPKCGREKERIPITGMRKVIADRMVATTTTAASVYLFAELDVTTLVEWREKFSAQESAQGARISMTALYIKALALALREVPICNSTIVGDEIVIWDNVNVAIAVALPGRAEYDSGLITPVLRDAEQKGLLAIDHEVKELVARARARTVKSEQLTGGTVNLSSNTGFFQGGWLIGTPLLNLPMVVTFGPGTPLQKPVVVDGQVVIRTMLPCNLTFDHRALDGEPAARLLRRIAHHFGQPELMPL